MPFHCPSVSISIFYNIFKIWRSELHSAQLNFQINRKYQSTQILEGQRKCREQRVFSHSLWSPFAVLLRVWRGWFQRSQCLTLPVQPEVHQHSERRDFPEIPEPSGRRGSGSWRGTERRFPHSGASERKTHFASQFGWEKEKGGTQFRLTFYHFIHTHAQVSRGIRKWN